MPLGHLRAASVVEEVALRWCERQRIWHGPDHLLQMLRALGQEPAGSSREILQLAALYHDAIYDPRATDNEERSAALLLDHAVDPKSHIVAQAAEIILASKWSVPPTTPLTKKFFNLDSGQLSDDFPLSGRIAYERAIFQEYQWADWRTYRVKRREFLEGWARMFPEHRRGVAECLELLSGMQPRIAVYPGSFAPFHLGHLSILRQAESIFDKVIVAVGVNRQKPGAIESSEARFSGLQSRLRFHEVAMFTGLLTSFVDDLPLPVAVVRGVRDGTDLEAELRYVRFLNELRAGTGVVWISCEAELQHLSSSAIRELESIAPHTGERYLPNTSEIYDLVGEVDVEGVQ
ncbi:MAG TPA: adenylyltransferase/cytidyltransferase family protein [Chthoniobacterales bacterium]|jgi:pantetheine-phosphate adenylyltransferase|nr:adenylyltransferase/cytidyltransferase family protein [Chthoniobacterales bacterium]